MNLKPRIHLLDLPGELLLKIFKPLDFRALRVLTRTSVYTNAIAIPILIDMLFPEIKDEGYCRVTSISEYTTYPFRLAFSLPPIPMRTVQFNIVTSHCNLIKGVRGVGDVLARVAPGIEKARLSFAVSQWGRADRTKQGVDKSVWIKEIFHVLDMLVQKGARVIEVDGFYDDLRLVRGVENYFVNDWKGAISRTVSSGGEGPDTRSISRAMEIGMKQVMGVTQLATPNEHCSLGGGLGDTHEIILSHCDCLFQPFILGRTLSFVNSLSHTLRSLTLDSRTLSTEDWHCVLVTLSLPQLSSCQFSARRVETDALHSTSKTIDNVDLFYFLGRHPGIKVFRFYREGPEEIRFRPRSMTTRLRLERSEPLLPGLEELAGSVRFVSELFRWNREATPRHVAVLPTLRGLDIESGFLLKGTVETHIANIQKCLGLIHDINNSGGLQALSHLGIDSSTSGSSPSFTLLDLLAVDPNLTSLHSSTDTRIVRPLPFIRDVTLASSEWKNRPSFDYSDGESTLIFRGFDILFPVAADLRFGPVKTGVFGSLKEEGFRVEVARMCPSLKRIHLGWVAGDSGHGVVDLDQYRQPAPKDPQQETRHGAKVLSLKNEASSSASKPHASQGKRAEANREPLSLKPSRAEPNEHSDQESATEIPKGNKKRKRGGKRRGFRSKRARTARVEGRSRLLRQTFYELATVSKLESVSARPYILSKHDHATTRDGVGLPDMTTKELTMFDYDSDPTAGPTIIVDSDGLTCLVRTSSGLQILHKWSDELMASIQSLLTSSSELGIPKPQVIAAFLKSSAIIDLIGWGFSVCQTYFPGLAQPYCSVTDDESYKETFRFPPPFVLFTEAYISGPALKREKVCWTPRFPTTANDIELVLLLFYSIPGLEYDCSKRSWLCMWEVGVCVELLPWGVVMLPAPLFYRSGLEVEDVQIITTASSEKPMPGMSTECPQDRGCLFLFNRGEVQRPSKMELKPAPDDGEQSWLEFLMTTDLSKDLAAALAASAGSNDGDW